MSEIEVPVAVPEIATEQYPGTALLRQRLAASQADPFARCAQQLAQIKLLFFKAYGYLPRSALNRAGWRQLGMERTITENGALFHAQHRAKPRVVRVRVRRKVGGASAPRHDFWQRLRLRIVAFLQS